MRLLIVARLINNYSGIRKS